MTNDDSIWRELVLLDLSVATMSSSFGAQVHRRAFAASWLRRVSSVRHFESITKIVCHFTVGGTCCDWTTKQFFRIDKQRLYEFLRMSLE